MLMIVQGQGAQCIVMPACQRLLHCCQHLLMSLGGRSQESIQHLGAARRPAFNCLHCCQRVP